jgi:hypothetical protein
MAASKQAELAFVDAPTGLAGFLLVVGIADSRSENEQPECRWTVRVPVQDAAAVRILIKQVQSWLRQERISETRVRVGEDIYRVGVGHADLQNSTEGSR